MTLNKFTNRLKKCQRLLSTFASVIFFIFHAFINVYYYFFGYLTHLCTKDQQVLIVGGPKTPQQIQDGGRSPFPKTVKLSYMRNRSTDFDEIS